MGRVYHFRLLFWAVEGENVESRLQIVPAPHGVVASQTKNRVTVPQFLVENVAEIGDLFYF